MVPRKKYKSRKKGFWDILLFIIDDMNIYHALRLPMLSWIKKKKNEINF